MLLLSSAGLGDRNEELLCGTLAPSGLHLWILHQLDKGVFAGTCDVVVPGTAESWTIRTLPPQAVPGGPEDSPSGATQCWEPEPWHHLGFLHSTWSWMVASALPTGSNGANILAHWACSEAVTDTFVNFLVCPPTTPFAHSSTFQQDVSSAAGGCRELTINGAPRI